MLNSTVRTLWTGDHLSLRMSRQIAPVPSTFGCQQLSNRTHGGLYGYSDVKLSESLNVRPSYTCPSSHRVRSGSECVCPKRRHRAHRSRGPLDGAHPVEDVVAFREGGDAGVAARLRDQAEAVCVSSGPAARSVCRPVKCAQPRASREAGSR